MKQKRAGYVLVTALLLLNLHFQPGAAEGNEPRRLQPKSESVPGVWVGDAPFRFQACLDYQQSHFRKASLSLAGDQGVVREERAGMRDAAQFVEMVPPARSVLAFKDRVMNKISPVLENPDGRLFMPMFSSENKNRMPRQEFSDTENIEKPGADGKESGRSDQGQERYFIGYRLSPRASQLNENWYLGLGWKSSGGGRGRRSMTPKDVGNDGTQRTNLLADSDESSQNAVKVEYSGPIFGLVGQF